jgi:hypothetical protein
MSRPHAWTSAVAAIAASIAFAVAPARGDWPGSGLLLATGPTQQTLPIGLTGPGGVLQAFWVDAGPSSPYALYSQHLTVQGTLAPGWPAGGRGVVAVPAAISSPKITPDGSGGAIFAWYDYRNSGGRRGIYAVRVDDEAAILPGWPSSGAVICTTNVAGGGPLNDLVAVCSDGAGGAFVAWTDSRNTPPMSTIVYDVFAHHVLSDGSLDPNWPVSGRALTTGSGYKYPHGLFADGSGGFWLATENSNATSLIAATQHDADGTETSRWISPSFSSRVIGVSDGTGGIFLTWRDCRDCLKGGDAIYAIRLRPGGAPASGWSTTGKLIGASAGDDDLPVIVATGDGAAMIAWLETGSSAPDAYVARRVEANGTFAFPWLGGEKLFVESTDILSGWPLIAPDSDGGAMFAFRRNRPNLFGSRVSITAQVPPAFPDTGLSLCTLSGNQFPVSLVSDGINGAFLLWQDYRDYATNSWDVYATRFTREGEVGSTTTVVVPPPVVPGRLAMSAPRPNPASALSSFDLTLPTAAHAQVEVLDLAGRLLVVLHDGDLPAGTYLVSWDGRDQDRRRMPPGVYLVRARTASATAARRIVRMP